MSFRLPLVSKNQNTALLLALEKSSSKDDNDSNNAPIFVSQPSDGEAATKIHRQQRPEPPQQLDAVGGHGKNKDGYLPILQTNGLILKPLQGAQPGQTKSRGETEADFYSRLFADGDPLSAFVPAFHGIEERAGEGGGARYLKLEDLTAGMSRPCVLDLKMGRRTYGDTASEAKKIHERGKYPPQEDIGFRIVGMRVFAPADDECGAVEKRVLFESTREWCRGISVAAMGGALERFFFDGKAIRYDLVVRLLGKLERIAEVLRDAPKYRIYGSSLLVVYDADGAVARNGVRDGAEERLDVRMIDFAHIFPITDGGRDDSYLHGLSFLRNCLQTTLSTEAKIIAKTGRLRRRYSMVGGSHQNISSYNGELQKIEDKPLQFDREVAFYRTAWGLPPPPGDGDGAAGAPDTISRFMPRLIRVNEEATPRRLVISDELTRVRPLSCPSDGRPSDVVSVMDVKLGSRSYGRNCPNEPNPSYYTKYLQFRQHMSAERVRTIWAEIWAGSNEDGHRRPPLGKLGKRDYHAFRDATTTSVELGFRLTALSHGGYKVSQEESRAIASRTQFLDRMERFLSVDDERRTFDTAVARRLVDELVGISSAVRASAIHKTHEMVGTSLLLLHCNGTAAVRWIDFANATPGSDHGEDNGIGNGIDQIRLAIVELIEKRACSQ